MAGQSVVISVLADTKAFGKGMSDAGKSAGGLSSAFKGIGIAAGAALAAAGVAVAGFVASSVKAAAEAEKVAAQTSAVLASTGGAAQRSAQQIGDLALSLSRMSGIDDEVVRAGQNVLLTFTRIQGANFDAATAAALDLSVALGKDMNSAATLVGKALNDPIAGIGALSKAGVQFTQEQKDVIASLVETGDVAGAQAIILGELNTQFSGSAEAFGGTFLGMIERVKNAFEGIQEAVGDTLLPILTEVGGRVATFLEQLADSPAFAAFLEGFSGFVTGLLSGESALGGLAAQLLPLLSFFSPLGLILKAITPVLPLLVDGLSQVAQTIGGALLAVLPTVTGLLKTLVGVLSGSLAAILPKLIPVVVKLAEVVGSVLAAVLPIAATLLEAVSDVLVALLPVVMPIIDAVLGVVSAFLPLVTLLAGLIGPILEPLIALLVALLVPILELVAPLMELLAPAIQFVGEVLANVIGWVVKAVAFFLQLITGSEEAKAGVVRVWQGVLDFFGGIPKAIGDFFAGAAKWLVDAGANIIGGLLNGIKKAVDGLFSFIGDIGKNIANTFKSVLGIRSPSTVFKAFGLDTIRGLELGLSAPNNLASIMDGLSSQVTGNFDAQLDAPTGYRAMTAGGKSYSITVQAVAPNAEVGRAVVQAIGDYERFGGTR